jgi:hypothetical protein
LIRTGNAGGAALHAKQKFGAVDEIGEGLIGQSYAYPTLDYELQKRDTAELEYSAMMLRYTAVTLPAVTFYLTKVGCGIAGYTEDEIKPLFADMPDNVIKPENW